METQNSYKGVHGIHLAVHHGGAKVQSEGVDVLNGAIPVSMKQGAHFPLFLLLFVKFMS